MNDDLDLSVIERHHDADPEYRETLRAQLVEILNGEEASIAAPQRDAHTIDLATAREHRPVHHRRRVILAMAGLAAAAALAAVIVVTSGEGAIAPADDTVVPTSAAVVETVPATDPAVVETLPAVEPVPGDAPALFTEIAPGSMVDLPEAPILGRDWSAVVWTGTEMIVWGGRAYDAATDTVPFFDDGAAFDLATGTWREIAPAPLRGRSYPGAVWTGTEMIVWGGFVGDDVRTYDGAAYHPGTDTWRMLPDVPFAMGDGSTIMPMVWVGDEAIVTTETTTAAYDPISDSWRQLDHVVGFGKPIWTGDSVVWAFDNLTQWDPSTDEWTVTSNPYAEVVGLPGADGTIETFVAIPEEVGAPVQILDSGLAPIDELPAFPGSATMFGPTIGAMGQWVSGQIIFHIWAGEFPYEPEQVWALDPVTGTWRQLTDSVPEGLVVVGDVLLSFGDLDGPESRTTATAYRVAPFDEMPTTEGSVP